MKRLAPILILTALTAVFAAPVLAGSLAASSQTSALWMYEAQTVYLGNLEREKTGAPPLRWNQQLTDAARWFSWDSVANRSSFWCGHTDTRGKSPWDRAEENGYPGWLYGENAMCATYLISPPDAINGWMNSNGHRENLLNPDTREIGLGYYSAANGRSYITQDFGTDTNYAPVVINNEAPQTGSPAVNLYVYDAEIGGWAGIGAAQEMQISGDACFTGAAWQPFQQRLAWTLPGSETGWRSVYVRTRDSLHRTRSVSDMIYLGALSGDAIQNNAQFSTAHENVTLQALGSSLPLMQFSLGWQADDTFPSFKLNWGDGGRVEDAAAWGGSAFELRSSGTDAWVYTHDFFRDMPMTAYVRMKVNDNTRSENVIEISITGGETRHLRGTDFHQPNVYQEFALPFTFASAEDFLIVNFSTLSSAVVAVDTVTIFTAPIPVTETYTWNIPGGSYRGRGVWVRYVDETYQNFSAIDEAAQFRPGIAASPAAVSAWAPVNIPSYTFALQVTQMCGAIDWIPSSSAGWLAVSRQDDQALLHFIPAALGTGIHQAIITIIPAPESGLAPLDVPFTVEVVESRLLHYLPIADR